MNNIEFKIPRNNSIDAKSVSKDVMIEMLNRPNICVKRHESMAMYQLGECFLIQGLEKCIVNVFFGNHVKENVVLVSIAAERKWGIFSDLFKSKSAKAIQLTADIIYPILEKYGPVKSNIQINNNGPNQSLHGSGPR